MKKQDTMRRCVTVAVVTVVVWQLLAWPLLKWSVGGTYHWIASYKVVKENAYTAEIKAYRDQLESLMPDDTYCDQPTMPGHYVKGTGDWVFNSLTGEQAKEWYYGKLYDWSQCIKNKYNHDQYPWVQRFLDQTK